MSLQLGTRGPRVVVGLLAFALAVPAALAQSPDGQGLIRVIEMEVRPERVDDWTALQRDELVPAQRAGGYPWVDVWQSGGAGNPYFRSIVVPMQRSMGELDAESVFERALGRTPAADLMARHRELITSINTRIVRPRPDLGFGQRPDTPSVGVLATITVAAGRAAEFEDRLLSNVLPLLRDSDAVSLTVGEILFGGQGRQYFALVYYPSFEAVRLEGLSLLSDQVDSPVAALDQTILRYNAAISSGTRE